MKKLIILGVAILLMVTGCKKDDPEISKTDLLTTGSWIITVFMSDEDGNGSFETSLYSMFPACVKDNFLTFKKNGEVVMDEGPSKCDASDPQTETVNWQLIKNETQLTIDGDIYDIIELDQQRLIIQDEYTAYGTQITFGKR